LERIAACALHSLLELARLHKSLAVCSENSNPLSGNDQENKQTIDKQSA
jgi:hypothetical protein